MKLRVPWIAVLLVLFGLGLSATALAQKARIDTYHQSLQKKMSAMVQSGQKCTVNMNDSTDGNGMDAEIRLTMGIKEFEDFAPIAALEAAAIPHKFPAVNIYLRHEGTGRVGRINFRDAEPLAAKYVAGGREAAIADIKNAITWH
ncbi:MAG TPA: hypothetical protein VLK65_28620 [Vicinamibacteria bacterium]|nr:hypothetical protein [Vicinamibacteria bacterium]